VGRIQTFDPSGFDTQIAAEVHDFDVKQFVPKSYRKATKVMARDIELAVAAADQAVRHARLQTPGLDANGDRSYPGPRTGCHIGAGLIAADIDELTSALAEARSSDGSFDIHKWGSEGMTHLTPLWLLKYLPNMLACHVTIIHDAQGPSNTITCGEASSGLSIGESLRVIQRGAADMCYCGGAESKINPMAFYRQQVMGRLTSPADNASPATALKPYDTASTGTVLGEGGGILTLESIDTAKARSATVYALVVGFGASHTVYPEGGGLRPDPQGKGIAACIRAALRDAAIDPGQIDLIIPPGIGVAASDQADAAALRTIFGDRLASIPLWSSKPFVGNCGAGAGAIDVALGAKMVSEQTIPARINTESPIPGLDAGRSAARQAPLRHVLIFSTSLGGQNVALILRKVD
jgi:3-oxoacyl-[acyl-carrier-protein] synthase II